MNRYTISYTADLIGFVDADSEQEAVERAEHEFRRAEIIDWQIAEIIKDEENKDR